VWISSIKVFASIEPALNGKFMAKKSATDLNEEYRLELEGPDDEGVNLDVGNVSLTDKQIEKQFETGRLRVVQDKNDFFLPHVVDFIEGRQWGNLKPEYQRRLRWSQEKKSKLIESFIMNVPVPPVFLFETSIGQYEVMDGQQRLNTILDFLKGSFELKGLAIWHQLNGKTFPQLPPLVRKGLERAKISAITLMSDSSLTKQNEIDLRAQVFDRLNTGGEKLNQQELRNSLYSGHFNAMIVDLAGTKEFTDAWGIPSHAEHKLSDDSADEELRNNNLYKRMTDCEIVLRFFAFYEEQYISGSVKSILDNCMKRNREASEKEVEAFGETFLRTLKLCKKIFGKNMFRLPENDKGKRLLSRPLYDAQMVSILRLEKQSDALIKNKAAILAAIDALGRPESTTYPTIVGRANTAGSIKDRINSVEKAIKSAL
jgi:hypothetical protein